MAVERIQQLFLLGMYSSGSQENYKLKQLVIYSQ